MEMVKRQDAIQSCARVSNICFETGIVIMNLLEETIG
jgi:hypothetical protein